MQTGLFFASKYQGAAEMIFGHQYQPLLNQIKKGFLLAISTYGIVQN